jgi:hypothetical protein
MVEVRHSLLMHLPRLLAMSLVAIALIASGCTTRTAQSPRTLDRKQTQLLRDHTRAVNREQAQLRSDYTRAEQPLPDR